MAKPFPKCFDSREEYESYCKCLNKTNAGDTVLMYTDDGVFAPFKSKTHEGFIVIGIEPNLAYPLRDEQLNNYNCNELPKKLLIGVKDDYRGIQSLYGKEKYIRESLIEIIKDYDSYTRMWWVSSCTDSLIHKIVRAESK